MPRKYTRKTTWGQTPLEEMEKAAAEVNREFGLADEVAEAVREHLNKYFQKLPQYIT